MYYLDAFVLSFLVLIAFPFHLIFQVALVLSFRHLSCNPIIVQIAMCQVAMLTTMGIRNSSKMIKTSTSQTLLDSQDNQYLTFTCLFIP